PIGTERPIPNPSAGHGNVRMTFPPLGKRLSSPVDSSSLVVFRLLFGVVMFGEVVAFWIVEGPYYANAKFLFSFFDFIPPLPGWRIYALFVLMGLAALGIALGFFYRVSATLYFLSFGYFFLLEKVRYNNHYYLILLLSFLLIFISPHRSLSWDAWLKPK